MKQLISYGIRIFQKYKKDEVTVYAAQSSFYIIIAFFPFIMLLLTLIQLIPAIHKSDLLELLVAIVPDMLDSLVVGIVDDLYTKSPATIVSITAVLALWSSSKGMMAIERGLNRVYESPQKRSYVVRRIICTGYTLLFIIACVGSLLLLVLGTSIQRLAFQWFPQISRIVGYLISFRAFMSIVLLTMIFVGLYTIVPVKKHKPKSQIPGAVFSTAGWMISSSLFSLYFDNFSNFSYMYGSLTAMVILMLWLYSCICILLIGGEINHFLAQED